ncbi:hypothetical protein [Aquabacterium sp. OR-4]|uniref:hypothetical protein n=1 Tax=Aquabacterium sp. OR-4 TaxID=2978127 RepID=UPI0021B19C1C|nr:hypothetical protein [Aquabacterium sp. OR-4]MDT7834845.1 hypothetical protein [Aquabacterium sp. OR-4]
MLSFVSNQVAELGVHYEVSNKWSESNLIGESSYAIKDGKVVEMGDVYFRYASDYSGPNFSSAVTPVGTHQATDTMLAEILPSIDTKEVIEVADLHYLERGSESQVTIVHRLIEAMGAFAPNAAFEATFKALTNKEDLARITVPIQPAHFA